MHYLITTLLDVIALLAIAAGVGLGASHWIGWWGLAVSGVLVLAGSQLANRAPRDPAGGGG